ncbi:enoyl-CoA hydratase/isomerase family protein [Streptomyces sp. NBC_01294]|uniref:enoyl-CoA hydratase/isomerase family protein n=1 Tax=Streptomyces sp. NBC_01294 TaxID=2903815 RepID=UPI002DDAF07C|nr:enoyl-CoA hydratase/isomerase family protein [Streptomyces sp. NBC_01294]WRZ56502.1 enoyl-CoA hydratase/isomerase family protein [Streptomyces sp. NBC_01294]
MTAPEPRVRLVVEDGIGTIELARPPVNALDHQAQSELREAAEEAAARTDVAAVVLYGGPDRFSAGADIREMAGLRPVDMVLWASRLQGAFTAVADIPKPVVAAVTGFALGGGCELALTADHRILAPEVQIGLPEIKLGVIPGAGGTQRLARLVGTARAKEIMFTGRPLSAAQALAVGLADRVVPRDEVLAEARAWAAQFVGGPALALRAVKQAVDLGTGTDLRSGLELERALFEGLFGTRDQLAGMRTFVEEGPGKAVFVGR